jgi:hypothetical protein
MQTHQAFHQFYAKSIFKKMNKEIFKKKGNKAGYLRNTKFQIGSPDNGGNSHTVMAIYLDNETKPLYFYSKDCKNLMKKEKDWSLEIGIEYLRKIWIDGGDSNTKFNKNLVKYAVFYPAVFGQNQTPIEVLYKREPTPSVSNVKNDSKYVLCLPKRTDLRKSEGDKYFTLYNDESASDQVAIQSFVKKFIEWENFKNRKAVGRLLIYERLTRKCVAELSKEDCKLYKPDTTILLYPKVVTAQR